MVKAHLLKNTVKYYAKEIFTIQTDRKTEHIPKIKCNCQFYQKRGSSRKECCYQKIRKNFSFSQKIWCRTQTVSYEGNFKSPNRQSACHKSAYYPRTVPIRWYHFCRIRPQVLIIFAKILLRFVCICPIMNNLRSECTNFKLSDLKCSLWAFLNGVVPNFWILLFSYVILFESMNKSPHSKTFVTTLQ